MIIVSACLAGVNCKYHAGNNECPWVLDYIKDKNYVLVCPEELGGLSTPRPPVEIVEGRAINKEGSDVTENFIAGAEKSLELAEKEASKWNEKIELAILKAKSPSCGSGIIYDGTFSGKLIEGNGFLAEHLKKNGIPVITELDEKEIGGLINDKL